jgi:hypothetical protein
MITFKDFTNSNILLEDTSHIKTHLSHLEDLAIEKGKQGFAEFIEQVTSLVNKIKGYETNTEINAKIDGSPMILFGVDPRKNFFNKFFISLKSGLSEKNPKIMHDDNEINAFYSNDVFLANKLKNLLASLRPAYDNSGNTYQADVLYSSMQDKKPMIINGENFVVFKPNTIVYAVPIDSESDISRRVLESSVGVIVHESFKPVVVNSTLVPSDSAIPQNQTIKLTSAGRNVQSIVESGKKNNVFIESSNYGAVSYNIPEITFEKIAFNLLQAKFRIDLINSKFNKEYITNPTLSLLKIYLNKQVDSSQSSIFTSALEGGDLNLNQFLNGFIEFLNQRFKKEKITKKTESGKRNVQSKLSLILKFIKENKENFKNLIEATFFMTIIKYIILNILSNLDSKIGKTFMQMPDGTLVKTKDEGYVLFVGTNHVKIVDRLDFTKMNRQTGGKRKSTQSLVQAER